MTFRLTDLTHPIIQAPMAGGPSTPALVAAVSRAGGLGSLAAGYRTAADMVDEIAAVRRLTDRPFAMNVFVPEAHPSAPDDLDAYARALRPFAADLGVPEPEVRPAGDDEYGAKLAELLADPVPVVSFTFGLPTAEHVHALQGAGSAVVLNATTVAEAQAALALDPDALVLQGPLAGGHRAQHDQRAEPSELPLEALLDAVRGLTSVPLIAAGGLATRADVARVLEAGAHAAQAGTAFLLAEEAGTKPLHRQALEAGRSTETVVTRVFSGRPARGLRNAFIERMTPHSVIGYPEVHFLTSPLRAVAADPEGINAWAGTGYAHCRRASAAEILADLAP